MRQYAPPGERPEVLGVVVHRMQVEVKFFAGLRERFGESSRSVSVDEGVTVGGLWQSLSGETTLGDNLRAAVNFEYAEPDTVLAPGDEVGFFPPVTGG